MHNRALTRLVLTSAASHAGFLFPARRVSLVEQVRHRLLLCRIAAVLVCAGAIVGAPAAPAATFKVLHAFHAGADGFLPRGRLVADTAGNLYGTTYYDGLGPYNVTVYMLV